MEKISSTIGGLLFSMIAITSAESQAVSLYITTEDSPPFNMPEGGKIVGIGTDKIKVMLEKADVTYKIELLPWKRAYESAMHLPNTCVYSTTRTAERENHFKWVGPIGASEWVLFGRADQKYDLSRLEDARQLKIGTYNGDVRDDYLRSRGYNVDTAQENAINIRKLLADRIALWATDKFLGNSIIVKEGSSGKIVPVLAFNKVELYLACNKLVPTALIERLNTTLGVMNRDGTSKALEQKYEHWPN